MQKNKKLIATLAITAAIAGWAAFRPELIFINKTVNENLAVSANETIETLAKGTFTSQAHETKGTAEIVKVGNKNFLRLSGFHTSNGPDVRVYLTNGENPSKASLPLFRPQNSRRWQHPVAKEGYLGGGQVIKY